MNPVTKNFASHALWLWLPFLFGLQSIPGTGALRTFFLLVGLLHLAALWRGSKQTPFFSFPDTPARLLGALTLWLLFHALFIAPQPAQTLMRLLEEWLKPLLLGGFVACVARRFDDEKVFFSALFAGAFLHVGSTLIHPLTLLWQGKEIVRGESLLGNYGYVSPFTSTALAWLLADLVSRRRFARALFPWSAKLTFTFLVLALAAEALLSAKAGQVMVIGLSLCALSMLPFPKESRPTAWGLLMALFLALALLIYVNSERWHGAFEAFQAATALAPDISAVTGSADPQAAVNRFEPSIYIRTAMAAIALQGLADHPWGLGYGGDAFGRYVAERFGIFGAVSSHSGWLDFALANGLPGLALLLLFAASLFRRGWRDFAAGNPAGAALALLTFHYAARSAIDGILYGSRLSAIALLLGALWAMTKEPADASRAS